MSSIAEPKLRLCVPSELNPPLNVTLVEDKNGLDRVADFLSRERLFGIDTETNITKKFYDRRVRVIQIGNRTEQYVIDLLAFAGSSELLVKLQGDYQARGGLAPVADVLRPALENHGFDPLRPETFWVKVGTNLQFDYTMLKWGLGLRMWHLYDIQIVEKLLHAGAVDFFASGFWALDDMVARYLGLHISKDEQKGFDLETPLTQKQLEYAGLDARLPLPIRAVQLKKIAEAALEQVARIENDAIPAFADMHLNGVLMDQKAWQELVDSNRIKKAEVVAKLDEIFVPVVGQKQMPPDQAELDRLENVWRDTKDKTVRATARKQFMAARKLVTQFKQRHKRGEDAFEGRAAINYGAPAQLRDALYGLHVGFNKNTLPDTNKQTLKKLRTNPKFKDDVRLALINEYRSLAKLVDTYGESWAAEGYIAETGRVHAYINQLGAETGRTSSTKPNIQNLPRDKRYRKAFIARPGHKIITIDWDGCELRILTEYSREPVWVDAFNRGWDVHSVCAEILLGDVWRKAADEICNYIEKKTKCACKTHAKFRAWLKSINFGIAYGMTAVRLALELGITIPEAETLLAAFHKAFPKLVKYLDDSGKHAVLHMEARTLAGRRRLFIKPTYEWARSVCRKELKREPTDKEVMKKYRGMFASIEREGKNTPIQGSNADMAKLAMGCGFDPNGKPYLWHVLEPRFDGEQQNFVHDEIVAEVPDEHAEVAKEEIGDCMSRAGAELVTLVPMTYEAHIENYWTK